MGDCDETDGYDETDEYYETDEYSETEVRFVKGRGAQPNAANKAAFAAAGWRIPPCPARYQPPGPVSAPTNTSDLAAD
jgi:hypothetical protein